MICVECGTAIHEEDTVYCYDARHDAVAHAQPCPCCLECKEVMSARCRTCEMPIEEQMGLVGHFTYRFGNGSVTTPFYIDTSDCMTPHNPAFWADLRRDREDARFRLAYFWASVRIWLVDRARALSRRGL